ncbi:unnamed protein product, partial [Phaeothamnion confervicola]
MTALHYATKANRVAVIRELMQLGADVGALNDNDQAPPRLTKDRIVRRLFQQYSGGGAAATAFQQLLRDGSASAATRVVDYVAVMTLVLVSAPNHCADPSKPAVPWRKAGVLELHRCPADNHRGCPFPDAGALAEVCT